MSRRGVLRLVLGLVAVLLSPVPQAAAAGCTRVIGGSQTTNWYVNGGYENLVANAEWERQTAGGKAISAWGVGGSGWTVPIGSACTPTGTLPTRVVVHVLPTGLDPSVEGISGHIAAALAGIAFNLPSVTRVTLIPPVHGVGCDHIDLSAWQPAAVEAINQNLSATVDAGPAVVVPDCSYFRDEVGHLTGSGAAWVAAQYAATLPGDEPPPPPPPGDTTPPTVSITSPVPSAVVSRSVRVTITATDNVTVTSVELRVDGVLAGTDTTSPYLVKWSTRSLVDGSYTLTAVANDAAGNSATSAPVPVVVDNTP
jgi:hypothetical protein